ncbi:MAG TPA: DMT family transporter [Usitatibacteraceae bacterium]
MSPRSPSAPAPTLLPVFALMLGATSWGILWYPFRLMQGAGLPAPVATLLSYLVSIVVGLLLFPRAWREFLPNTAWMLGIGLSAGFTNVAYLVAIMEAEVLRIVLLFYLAPLWTVPLARLILKERLTLIGYATAALAMAGAVVMLWQPALGFPAPRNGYEWLGLAAGFAFALCNVLVKGAHQVTPQAKSLAGAIGVAVVALPVALWLAPGTGQWLPLAAPHALLIAVIGAVLMSTSVTLQYGLSKLAANRAAVVLLFELVVAAVAAHFLAGEVSRLQDWAGGAMIVAAGMMAAFWEHRAAKLAAS